VRQRPIFTGGGRDNQAARQSGQEAHARLSGAAAFRHSSPARTALQSGVRLWPASLGGMPLIRAPGKHAPCRRHDRPATPTSSSKQPMNRLGLYAGTALDTGPARGPDGPGRGSDVGLPRDSLHRGGVWVSLSHLRLSRRPAHLSKTFLGMVPLKPSHCLERSHFSIGKNTALEKALTSRI
jgi:hypothetical protein